jgi:hypothetical protein
MEVVEFREFQNLLVRVCTSARRQHFDTLSDQAEGEKACMVSFLTFFNGIVISATLY